MACRKTQRLLIWIILVGKTRSPSTSTQYFIKYLNFNMDAPSIVLCGSTGGKFGEAYYTDYASSKSALMYGFINSVKNEIVEFHPKARINAVALLQVGSVR